MQWCGSTKKSPNILNATENKFDTGDLFMNGETTEAKPHRVNFRSPLTRIHYYQSQVVTSIRNLTKTFGLSLNTNLQLNPYPNT